MTTVALTILLPKELPVDRNGKIDYVGATLGVSSLILFNFVWNQAPSAKWLTSYIIATLILSVAFFVAFVYWEKRVAREPIMPLSIFKIPTFSALVIVVLLSFMSYATSLYYMIAWQQLLRGWTALDVAIGWIPFAIGAVASTLVAAWLIARLPAQWIVAIGVGVVCVSSILLATMPRNQSYWEQTFPAILIGSFCPDFVFTAAQIIASNSVSRKQQGVAASLIGTLNLYGASLGLGFAGTIESQTNKGRANPIAGYRAALAFAAGIAAAAIVVTAAFVRVPKNDREGWEDEDNNAADVALVSSRVAEVASGLNAQASGRR